MTRELALQHSRNELSSTISYQDMVNLLYDSIEAQQCKHCNYFKEDICCNSDSPLCCEFVSEDFGCNQFIKQEPDTNKDQ